ncbi:hypothetical protein, partial [Pseudomonas inefficax]|uniref:hypothetical protein n=1 Tax=Pseudomonas inefficax TaxID=2078786 RepID=UPI002DBD474C
IHHQRRQNGLLKTIESPTGNAHLLWQRPCVAKGARSGPSFLRGQGANEKFSETSLVIEYGGLM